MKFINTTTIAILLVLFASANLQSHSDLQHILLQGKNRYEGFLSGLLDDPYFKVSQSCFSFELTEKVDSVFSSISDIFFNRDISQALKLYDTASEALQYFMDSCNVKVLFRQFYQLCAYQNACNLRNFVINLKDEVNDVMMHLGNHAYISYQIENTWDQDVYFELVRDKYRHIGALVGLAFGEKHDHSHEDEEKQEEMSVNLNNVQQLNKVSYVQPDQVKQDYTIIKHLLQGILQGLSEKGNEKKSCYKNVSYMKSDFDTALDLLVKSLEGANNVALISLAATQTYGHIKAIYRDCRLSNLVEKMFNLHQINDNLNENKEELNGILVNFGMAALTRDFVRAGQLMGNLIKISLDFYVF